MPRNKAIPIACVLRKLELAIEPRKIVLDTTACRTIGDEITPTQIQHQLARPAQFQSICMRFRNETASSFVDFHNGKKKKKR